MYRAIRKLAHHARYRWIIIASGSFIMLLALISCQRKVPTLAHGYIEGRFTRLSSSVGGTLTDLLVKRGDAVNPGQLLFKVDQEAVEADLQAAEADVKQAAAQLADVQKGKRESEIESLIAQQHKVEASRVFAQKEVKRYRTLSKQNHIEERQLDIAVKNLAELDAERDRLRADLETAKLPARVDIIEAAKASLKVANARLKRARWRFKQTHITAPKASYVYDTFYRVGEEVPPNQPVVSLIVPDEIKAVFFVGAPDLNKIHLQDTVRVRCIHCESDIEATVVFISPEAEYTPPVIYSEESREKLVYRIEAAFKLPLTLQSPLHQGQPITISLAKLTA